MSDEMAKCSYCRGRGRRVYERGPDGWPVSHIQCRDCGGTGRARVDTYERVCRALELVADACLVPSVRSEENPDG